MDLQLDSNFTTKNSTLNISGSKSETNRLLILQALYPNITLENTSSSDDSEAMIKGLSSKETVIDIHHAGTTMRFLAAFFAMQDGEEKTLTGSSRMKERPIKVLVDGLRQLGAEIEYIENEGFPPIRIKGKKITQNKVNLKADVSSQYISALLLIGSKLENGLEITLEGTITSVPYIKMTLELLKEIGIKTNFEENKISVFYKSASNEKQIIAVESDWSSASYFYSIVAMSKIGTEIILSNYKKHSLQGDAALSEIYKNFGVETKFNNDNSISIKKINIHLLSTIKEQLNNTPDIAQTIVVTCLGLGVGCHLTGLHTLKIKETDRLEALKIELSKLGATIEITDDSLTLEPVSTINPNIKIATYNDHRMAMAFAPLSIKVPMTIENAEVVSKSFPDFWDNLKTIGFQIKN